MLDYYVIYGHIHNNIFSSTLTFKENMFYVVYLLELIILFDVFSIMQLATHKNALGVAVGATLGHTICTSIAVVGGSMLASKISQGTVATIGGLLFLGFSLSSYFYPPL